MENIIKYYYNLYPTKINDLKDVIIIEVDHELYIAKTIKDKAMFTTIVSLPMHNYIYKPILNKNNSYYFEYNNITYTLFKVDQPALAHYDNFIIIPATMETNPNYTKIWENNIDYFIKELTRLDYSKTELIDEINYYIGLAENAIMLNERANKLNMEVRLCLSHYRIKYPNYSLTYNDPTEITIDYISRDIAEYTKSKFFNDDMQVEEFLKIVNRYNLNDKEILYLFARLLYPNYFFDLLDDKNIDKREKIMDKREKYEKFLKDIFSQIKTSTLNVDMQWL